MAELTPSLIDAYENGWHALRLMLPILSVAIVFLMLVVVVVRPATSYSFRNAQGINRRTSPLIGMVVLYGVMFGTLGALVGLLFSISSRGSFESYVPHIILVLTVIFQLMGRLKGDWSPPLRTLPTIIGTTTAAFVFVFTILYLHELGFSEKFNARKADAGFTAN